MPSITPLVRRIADRRAAAHPQLAPAVIKPNDSSVRFSLLELD
jgi:hypothetical protein